MHYTDEVHMKQKEISPTFQTLSEKIIKYNTYLIGANCCIMSTFNYSFHNLLPIYECSTCKKVDLTFVVTKVNDLKTLCNVV